MVIRVQQACARLDQLVIRLQLLQQQRSVLLIGNRCKRSSHVPQHEGGRACYDRLTFRNFGFEMRYVHGTLLGGKHEVGFRLPCALSIAKRLVSYILFFAVGNDDLRGYMVQCCKGKDGCQSTLRSASCFSARSI